jgi:glutamyl-tRNA synthetase
MANDDPSEDNGQMSGRFAPSPTGTLHVGNLRTAVAAWLAARQNRLDFIVRMEDLDRVQSSIDHEYGQLSDLAAIGIDWDGEVVRQSERFSVYNDALDTLRAAGLVYECYCTRREVRAEIEAAPRAPHLPPGSYPGTCRTLTTAKRRRFVAEGRAPALRLRAPESSESGAGSLISFVDLVAGFTSGGADDVVLRRNDGVPAYNLAVVVDDAIQGITQVVRGDDLLSSTPRQIHLQRLLNLATPTYGHVPLVVGGDGERLSKRHGSVTLAELRNGGMTELGVLDQLVKSLRIEVPTGLERAAHGTARERLLDAVSGFRLDAVAARRVVFSPLTQSIGDGQSFELRNVS